MSARTSPSQSNRIASRYRPFVPVGLRDRTWPDATITAAPRWLSTDLRDGNQALIDPMCPERKLAMFQLLTTMGYREIEVGFPSASQADFDFVRMLITDDLIPDGVTISVLTPARDELIERSVASLAGAPAATLHLYNATAPIFRDVVFGVDRDACRAIAVQGTQLVRKYAEKYGVESTLGFEYSPEVFVDTELDFALEVCAAVAQDWQPAAGREIIVNLPSTVERATPNVFADQIEWMSRQLPYREHTCLSVHPHNDRGTGVASAELAVMAGAQRIEGCLFGNGERAGNVCLVTLGLNLLSQGVDPGIDFSDIDAVRSTVEYCTGLPVHPRHPYGGELVHTAFSGSHQDAINKGFAAMELSAAAAGVPVREHPWTMPYLPLDPRDLGRNYDAVIRVNSQSGKGALAYLMKTERGLELPRGLQIEFARVIQAHTDAVGGEVRPDQLWAAFTAEYLQPGAVELLALSCVPRGRANRITADLRLGNVTCALRGDGDTPVVAYAAALGQIDRTVRVQSVHLHPRTRDGVVEVAAYVECVVDGRSVWGAALCTDTVTAPLYAVTSAVNRAAAITASAG